MQRTFVEIFFMGDLVNEFNDYRERMNEIILSKNNLVMKRLWNLDTNTYDDGALDKKTKEMLGLVASMVLRCDDCIKYHLGKSHELGATHNIGNRKYFIHLICRYTQIMRFTQMIFNAVIATQHHAGNKAKHFFCFFI